MDFSLILFHEAFKGMTALAGMGVDFKNLGFGDISGVQPAQALTLIVNVQHDLGGLLQRFAEMLHDEFHDEIHGGKIIVEKDHLIEGGFPGFGIAT